MPRHPRIPLAGGRHCGQSSADVSQSLDLRALPALRLPHPLDGDAGVEFRRARAGGQRRLADDAADLERDADRACPGLQHATDHAVRLGVGRACRYLRPPPDHDGSDQLHGIDVGASGLRRLDRGDHALGASGLHLPDRSWPGALQPALAGQHGRSGPARGPAAGGHAELGRVQPDALGRSGGGRLDRRCLGRGHGLHRQRLQLYPADDRHGALEAGLSAPHHRTRAVPVGGGGRAALCRTVSESGAGAQPGGRVRPVGGGADGAAAAGGEIPSRGRLAAVRHASGLFRGRRDHRRADQYAPARDLQQ